MNMNKNTSNPVYVVYNPRTTLLSNDYGYTVIPSGLRLVPYPLATDKIKFVGNYLECTLIYNALLYYNPN